MNAQSVTEGNDTFVKHFQILIHQIWLNINDCDVVDQIVWALKLLNKANKSEFLVRLYAWQLGHNNMNTLQSTAITHSTRIYKYCKKISTNLKCLIP